MALKSVKTFLAASANIANLVADKLYPLQAPQKAALPYIVLDKVSDSPEYELQGESGKSRLVAQVECYGRTYYEASEVAAAVRNRLSGYGPGLLDDTVYCSKATIVRDNELVEPREEGSDEQTHRVSMDYEIVYGRTVPDFT